MGKPAINKDKINKMNIRAKLNNKVSVAFDFGRFSTKIVIGKPKDNHAAISKCFMVENKGEFEYNTANINKIKSSIAKAFKENSFFASGQNALCVVDSSKYITRVLTVPNVEEKDMLGIISYELSKLLAIQESDYYFQYNIINAVEVDGKPCVNVRAIAVSKEICNFYYDIITSLKLNPAIMDVDVNGISRYILTDKSELFPEKNSVAFVDYGFNTTKVSVFNRGVLIDSVIINTGDVKFVTAIKNVIGQQACSVSNSNKLTVHPKEIIDILNNPNRSSSSRIVISVIEELISEINSFIKKYNINFQSMPVSNLYLYGGSPQLAWLKMYIEKYINIKTEVLQLQRSNQFNISNKAMLDESNFGQYFNSLNSFLV